MESSIPRKLSQVEEPTTFAIKDNNTRHQSGIVSLILSKQYNIVASNIYKEVNLERQRAMLKVGIVRKAQIKIKAQIEKKAVT